MNIFSRMIILLLLVVSGVVLAVEFQDTELHGDKFKYEQGILENEALEIAKFVKEIPTASFSERLPRDLLTDLGRIKRAERRNGYEVNVRESDLGYYILDIYRISCGVPNCALRYTGWRIVKY